ncbi:MAG: DUF47 family protein [Chloroflexota bacterium]|nr:DUF47 family protein [Chloroflexota bacterium]
MRLRLRLIPNEERFFEMFEADAANVVAAARLLLEMLERYDDLDTRYQKLRDAEHRGDELSHDIGHRLERTFVTPIDREDIHGLISGLDDVIDFIEEVGDTFVLYGIDKPTESALEQARIIVRQCEQIHEAMGKLEGFRDLDRHWIEVHRLENEGDVIVRRAIAAMFEDGMQPLDIIKWKDVYSLLEQTIDKCEDVANIVERITIKHA